MSDPARRVADFVRRSGGGVVATNSADGCPESAWVNLAAFGDGRLVFGTNERSRKYANLLADPRVSLVVVSGAGQEFQLEGEAALPDGADARAAEQLLESRHPGATGKPSTRVVTVRPRWARFVDVAAEPPVREEFSL
ncbi:pyridoxamine 5'-phosphate oxidase family protein [Kocuria sp. M1R5S2]|uniref:pyridoxamine 5'-phosphate oxidase family protein n=1 Tax=Kocuria rhizosphaerae TaxID=3376285 RepID=UPI00379863C4